jgi:hypothetical protein
MSLRVIPLLSSPRPYYLIPRSVHPEICHPSDVTDVTWGNRPDRAGAGHFSLNLAL